jgi:hypothetical protein
MESAEMDARPLPLNLKLSAAILFACPIVAALLITPLIHKT